MTRAKHRPPPRLTVARVAVADGAVLAFGLTFAVATSVAPHAHAPVTVAAPTAVDLREPTGHGGLGGPLATPSIGADGAWQPKYGPVIVNGQALAKPTVALPEPEPIPEPGPAPTPVPAPPVAAASTDEPTPVVVVPEPTEPTDEPETTPPSETPAEPTVPVVEVTP